MPRSQKLLIFIFVFWLVVFFPRWYVLSYTKVWELDQLVGASWEQQLAIMHPDEMDSVLALKQSLRDRGLEEKALVVAQKQPSIPLASEPLIVRAVLYPVRVTRDLPVASADEYVIFIQSEVSPLEATASGEIVDEFWRVP